MADKSTARRWRCVWVADAPLMFDVLGHVVIFSECIGDRVPIEHAARAADEMIGKGDDVIAVVVPDGYETQALDVLVRHRADRNAGLA